MIIYNKYTNECLQTTYVNPLCKEINDDFLSCKECIDPQAILEKQCKCNDGYYNPSGSKACMGIAFFTFNYYLKKIRYFYFLNSIDLFLLFQLNY